MVRDWLRRAGFVDGLLATDEAEKGEDEQVAHVDSL
jgi:hypothetical protein